MKYISILVVCFIVLLVILSQLPVTAVRGEGETTDAILRNADAVEALAIANQWKWTKKDVRSYVNSREVVFQFPGGTIKKIPLPAEKMVVALAPYVKGTHT